jgi:hypothetical protein
MLTDPELDAKFMRLTQNSLDEDRAKQLMEFVERLKRVSDVAELNSLLGNSHNWV